MIIVKIPDSYENERRYILDVMLNEFLGLEIEIEVSSCNNMTIVLAPDRQIEIADVLFATEVEEWLKPESLPLQPLKIWDLNSSNLQAVTVNQQIPIIYGKDPARVDFFIQSESQIYLGLDIFGSAFFMLTRYEEVIKSDRDKIDRFPAAASLAYQEDFLARPIVNEYLEILWACIKALNPKQERKIREFQIHLSHDVDEPFRYAFSGVGRLARRCAGDVWKRRSYRDAVASIRSWIEVKSGNTSKDPCNTFDLIMDISERYNLKSAFYFITDRTSSYDGDYRIDNPLITNLMRQIHDRGHEIGLHPSYNTYQDAIQTQKEFESLRRVCDRLGIQQQRWGGRQHCLRWENPTTWKNWDQAELDYDSTLSFAEIIGYRCGTCYEYSTFDLIGSNHLKLKEIPLTIMDATILQESYMGLGNDEHESSNQMIGLKKTCQMFNGSFVLLWHNSYLHNPQDIDKYLNVVRG
jgi:hypothetical protein